MGDGRHFPAALLLPEIGALAAHWHVSADDARARLAAADLQPLFQPVVDAVNRDLAQFERIKKFVVIAEELTMAGGLLTPTLKVKRRVFEARYRQEIEGMYQ